MILPPGPLLDRLEKEHRANIVRSLRMERELITLQQKFSDAGLCFMPLKGIALSRYLYGDPALRPCGDIDILTAPGQMAAAAELLQANGYRRHELLQPLREKFNRRISHHQAFFCHRRGFYLELHRALSPRLRSTPADLAGLWQRVQRISLSGEMFPFPGAEDLLLHLAVHSAASCWQSLLQLHDLAALLRKHPDLDWPALLARAAEWRCRRRLLLSLAVTAAVWLIRLPPTINREIASESSLRPALASALRWSGLGVQPAGSIAFPPEIKGAWRNQQEITRSWWLSSILERKGQARAGQLPDVFAGRKTTDRIIQLVFFLCLMDSWRDRGRILMIKTANRLIKLICRLDRQVTGMQLRRPEQHNCLKKITGEAIGTRS